MTKISRVFLIVLDSFGVGELPDAADYGDAGSHTLKACFDTGQLHIPTLGSLGLFNLDGIDFGMPVSSPFGAFGRMGEASNGKDTTIGHWEISGIISPKALPTYPEGFPEKVISSFEKETGYRAICNKPYSGTEVLKAYGREHLKSKSVIVYTSADSVFQIAAHIDVVPIDELYRICIIVRNILVGEHGVGRVIARPFSGAYPDFKRTPDRKDFSIKPPKDTFMDVLSNNGLSTIAVGKIEDIFSGAGITEIYHTKNNQEGMKKTEELIGSSFSGLCFTNLVDFDMVYGHRNDAVGYANALNDFDCWLNRIIPILRNDDVIMITADHGCDPSTSSTDHSREYVPLLIHGSKIKQNLNLETRKTFADIGKTIIDLFDLKSQIDGESIKEKIIT